MPPTPPPTPMPTPMPMPPGPVPASGATSPGALRERARLLRSVAATLDHSEAHDLHRRAGDDVWAGPTPRRCRDDLVGLGHLLLLAGRELRSEARALEVRAAAADAAGC